MATIYEVAARAGVSPATVSRWLNGATVSPDKVRRIRQASAELRFVPNRSARRLRSQTSELIALLVPDIENPFFGALARGVEDRALAAGYSVVLCNTDDDETKETHYFDIANSENMAGVILAPSAVDGDVQHLLERGRPVVAIDRHTSADIDAVRVDNLAAGRLITTAMLDRGYSRVACIAGARDQLVNDDRAHGWLQEMSGRLDGPADRLLEHANYRADGGRAAMARLLDGDERPEAVIVTNNLMGVGAIQLLLERGISPTEFGVGLIGELPYNIHPLEGVVQMELPDRQLGVTAAGMLLERIAGDTQPARTVVLRCRLL